MIQPLLYLILLVTFFMVVAKRINALITAFAVQSFFLFVLALSAAMTERHAGLFVVAALILVIKAVFIPWFLRFIVRKIAVGENLGLFVNPNLSLLAAAALTYLAHLFIGRVLPAGIAVQQHALTVSVSVMLIGLFIMIFRMKAIAQIVGLLVMENGLFLAAACVCGGMPFFMELAVFFDVFMCVLILGMFVYRVNMLFTHIDVSRLSRLKG